MIATVYYTRKILDRCISIDANHKTSVDVWYLFMNCPNGYLIGTCCSSDTVRHKLQVHMGSTLPTIHAN